MIGFAGRFHQASVQSESSFFRNGALTGGSPGSAGSAAARPMAKGMSRRDFIGSF
jgi:hypothetical protein